jgi:hypothetical protein
MSAPLTRRAFAVLAAGALAASFALPASAQLGGLGRAAGRLAQHANVDAVLRGDAPITTALPDARWAVDSLDNFTPREAKRSLTQLQRTPNGGFVLQPGYYEFHDQSYCLHAGTHGPGGGDGYLYAPPRGPAEDAVMSIVRNSVNKPNIEQHDVQVLLWAIIARSKFEDLDSHLKATATQLLTPRQLAALNRTALDLVPGPALDAATNRMPTIVRQAFQAEAQLRQLMTQPGTPYDQMERVAVLAGLAPMGEGSRQVPSGRWSLHPDGYYIRYLPYSYTNTLVQIWVPQGSPAVGKEYDPATHIAVPGNTARQRLIQSGRPYQNH